MLTINVPLGAEFFDDRTQEFVEPEYFALTLEHSLVALSKWEEIWEKPFITDREKTTEEVIDYVKCMTLTPDVPPEVYNNLTQENYEAINDLLNAKMSATWFGADPSAKANSEVITAELIFHWMWEMKVPMECAYWHINKLFTQMRVIGAKSAPPKKMSVDENRALQRRLNAQRKKELGLE